MVIVLTLRAPGHAGGGCGSDKGPDGFGDDAPSPFEYCEERSKELRVPEGGAFSGAKSDVDACQGREQPDPTANSIKAAVRAAFTRITFAAGLYPQDAPRHKATALSERLRPSPGTASANAAKANR